jgi:phage gp45-like
VRLHAVVYHSSLLRLRKGLEIIHTSEGFTIDYTTDVKTETLTKTPLMIHLLEFNGGILEGEMNLLLP